MAWNILVFQSTIIEKEMYATPQLWNEKQF